MLVQVLFLFMCFTWCVEFEKAVYQFGSGGFRNVPYDWINKQKSNQNWLRKQGEKFLFPGGGTMFPKGVSAYVDLMQDLIPELKDGTVRTAMDTGCGVSELLFWFLFRCLIFYIIIDDALDPLILLQWELEVA